MQLSKEQDTQPMVHKNSTPESKLLEIERKFNAPLDRLFDAFTTPAAVTAWWWPKGLHTDHVELDFNEGGKYFINMKGMEQGGAGGGMVGKFEDIIKNKTIVMSDQFADDKGRVISAKEAKMEGEWPEFVYITFDFEPIDSKTSQLKLSQEGIPNQMQSDCIKGWNEMFDKLDNYLGDRRH